MYTKISIFLVISFFIVSIKTFKPHSPLIGIISTPNPPNGTNITEKSYIWEGYIRWIEQTGARIIPIHPWYNQSYVDTILSKVNGVLFLGINRIINISNNYEKFGSYIIDKAIEMNKKNDYFPIFGICFGYELFLAHIANDNNIIREFDAMKIMVPSELAPNATKSKLFSNFNKKDFDNISKLPITYQIHRRGISLEDFDKFESVKKFFTVTSYALDKNGKKYINSIEAKDYPIYGIQYHPEVSPFARADGFEFNHTIGAVRISQLHSLLFLAETEKNLHKETNNKVLDNLGMISSYTLSEGKGVSYTKGYYTFEKQ